MSRIALSVRQAAGPVNAETRSGDISITADAQHQYWANYVETGPGARFRFDKSPVLYSVSLLRGAYLVNQYNPRRPNYTELRVGLWYAFTH